MIDTFIRVRVEENLKDKFEEFCKSVGISMSAAVNLFITATVKEQRIPFEISAQNDKSE